MAVGGAADGAIVAEAVVAGGSGVEVSCRDGRTVGIGLGDGSVVAGAFDSVGSGAGCGADPHAHNENTVIAIPTQKRFISHLCPERRRPIPSN